MATSDALTRLQDWYLRQCDGDWEHSYGVTVESLDNPGWRVRIDLHGTPLAGRAMERTTTSRSEQDWLVRWVEEDRFHAACGPRNLAEALEAFLLWAD